MQNHDDDNGSPKRKPEYRRGQAPGSRAHQFESGKSGNRPGRPKSRKATKSNPPSSSDALLTEGNRLVTLNDTGETLTVLQLMLRAETTLGVKGNAVALRHSIDRITEANKERSETINRIYGWAVEWKEAYAEQRRRGVSQRISQCEAFPHPDNIVLNPMDSGLWLFDGLTREQAAARAGMRQHLKLLERILTTCKDGLERHSDDRTRQGRVSFFYLLAQ